MITDLINKKIISFEKKYIHNNKMTETFDIPLPYNKNNDKNNDTPFINNVKVKFISAKQDKFGKDISYFKITSEIKQILGYLNGDYKVPFWVADDGIVLKVNSKFVPKSINQKGQFYEVIIEMNYYEFQPTDKEMIKGYYAKLYV